MNTLEQMLGPEGRLARFLQGFVVRPNQQAMAGRVAEALADAYVLIAESGTGTGKTFAYLVPALLSGKKVIISTGTRNLQDQLYDRDLPLVRRALDVPVTTALLKGRANYLCLHRLERAEIDVKFVSGRLSTGLVEIRQWAGRTTDGDMSGVENVPEDSTIWPQVTSTAENCLGADCSYYDDCYVNRARREALAADVLVVNHHLFFADIALKQEGFGQLLPGVDAVIFDEAHQLPDVAAIFFDLSVSSQQFVALCRDVIAEDLTEHSGIADLNDIVHDVEKAASDFRLSLGLDPRRDPLWKIMETPAVKESLELLMTRLERLNVILDMAAGRGEGLANCYRRAGAMLDRLLMMTDNQPVDYVPWIETTAKTFTLHLTPLDIAGLFREQIQAKPKGWVFTSATLAVNNGFAHFQSRMGLENAETCLWESPFDYANKTLLYIPKEMPFPSARDYTHRVVQAVRPVLAASRGRAFLLFTSHRALKRAADLLPGSIEYPLLVQGSRPRSELLQLFRSTGNAVLLGTGSFWEGVDVRGEALSFVMIDKLPFAAPDDPVLQARGAAMEQAGRSPFMEYQLPEAVIALKQGAGRLIRDEYDRGCLMLCDPRLLSKGYGRIFLNSLPSMPLTRCLEDVQCFFATEPDNNHETVEQKTVLT